MILRKQFKGIRFLSPVQKHESNIGDIHIKFSDAQKKFLGLVRVKSKGFTFFYFFDVLGFDYQRTFNTRTMADLTRRDVIFLINSTRKVRLKGVILSEINLAFLDLRNAFMSFARLERAKLIGADLTGADLTDADLASADLTGAELRGAILRNANLRGAILTGADLTDADLTGAELRGADFAGAELRGAKLTGAHITHAQHTGADFIGADLKGAIVIKQRS